MIDPTISIFIPENTFTDAFTQSELGTWDECAFKWYLRYAHRLDKIGSFNWSLMFGTALHSSTALFYQTKGEKWFIPLEFPEGGVVTLEDEKKLEVQNTMLEGVMDAYAEFFKDDIIRFKKVEQLIEQVVEVEIEYKGFKFKLKGTLDWMGRIVNDQLIIDTKSTWLLSDGQKEAWQMRFQFLFYVWLAFNSPTFRANKPARFMINGVKKPALRLNKGENLNQFKNRIYKDVIQDPGKYFWREEMIFDRAAIERIEKEHLFPKLDRIVVLYQGTALNTVGAKVNPSDFLATNKNTDACFNYNVPCPYLGICKTSFVENEDQYEQREQKHPNYERVSE